VPLDDRVTFGDNIFAPLQGTPLPPGAGLGPQAASVPPAPQGAGQPVAPQAANIPVPDTNTPPDAVVNPAPPQGPPPGPVGVNPAPPPGPLPGPAPADNPDNSVPQAAPASSNASEPAVATAQYDPRTGRYLTADGQLNQQADLVASSAPKTWQDMLPK
jgi:phospholipid/cholesterol/gamma-HCH transport system substrate-binding protein